MIIGTFSDRQLLLKVIEGKEAVRSIEFFIVFPVAALDFPVVSRGVWLDQLVSDSKLRQSLLKESWLRILPSNKAIGEFSAIVSLDALNSIRETFYAMLNKQRRRIGAFLWESLQVTKTAVLINESILIPLGWFCLPNDASLRDKFDIDLDPLAGILHLLIRFGCIFLWIRQFLRHSIPFPQKAIQTGNRTCISPGSKLHPEYNEAGIRVPTAHIQDEFDLLWCVLIWMAVRAVRTVLQRVQRAVIALHPAVDILAVGVVTDCCLRNAVFLSELN